MKFYLGDYEYPTKSEFIREISSYLKTAKSHIITNQEMTEKLSLLLHMHPSAKSKIGPGIKHFKVVKNAQGSGNSFVVVRIDGTEDRFSYEKCITNQRPTKRSEVLEALRFAVRDQLFAFRRKLILPIECAISGNLIEKNEDLHIDHKTPFSELVRVFLEIENTTLEKLNTSGNGEHIKLVDEELEFRFKKFHESNAVLQPSLMKENIRKGNDLNCMPVL
ncbi:MAG: hypothetical protein A2023_07220 [Sulfuricurvum sp. GWF2_44_89]|nr:MULTISPECIES: DCL family protein [Sulfuricurvum]OHD78285.1 MAG: hypothetical protein A2023_07220 [Sulfuricurvum sp. GWF2_44_89]OHD91588.1 MAG: hypothetical protein A2517_07160 [Sulfuricurvum sp. RIFOXYD12_FULL_44_77]OHD94154.1 MAG: hypothetical protein A2552_01705 [Sulfuricurvum sp. RIFOXYD2_FULL_44_160]